jgi:hypothetical protein
LHVTPLDVAGASIHLRRLSKEEEFGNASCAALVVLTTAETQKDGERLAHLWSAAWNQFDPAANRKQSTGGRITIERANETLLLIKTTGSL